MTRLIPPGLAALIVLLFLVANRGAYEGYFHDDDLDNLAWTSQAGLGGFARGLVDPVFSRNNFRPVGHFFYRAIEPFAGLDFRWYVAVLQILHLLNAILVWALLRRFKAAQAAAVAGVLFFAFHAATFDAYWRPMYVFDVLCGTFSLLCLHAWMARRTVVSFACFWLAYRAKELAIMLPAVLLAYEMIAGGRRWRPLAPFFAVSLWFGAQAWIANRNAEDAYTFRLTVDTVSDTVAFYSSNVLLLPLGGLALLAATAFVRDRRLWFAAAGACLLAAPLLALPNRMFSVYLYVPLAFFALAAAVLLEHTPRWAPPIAAAALMAVTYTEMREYRRATLTIANENRGYVRQLETFVRAAPDVDAFLWDGRPAGMNPWGIAGALRYYKRGHEIRLSSVDAPESRVLMHETNLAVLSWDGASRRLDIYRRDAAMPDAPYVRVDQRMPVWQFGDGWFPRENEFRWTGPRATARLFRPADASRFEVRVNLGPMQMRDGGAVRLRVLLDGTEIGSREFQSSGWQTAGWEIVGGPAKPVTIEFRVDPPYRPRTDPRTLGIAIGGFGFRS